MACRHLLTSGLAFRSRRTPCTAVTSPVSLVSKLLRAGCASAADGILVKSPALAAGPLDSRGGGADYDSELSARNVPSATVLGGGRGSSSGGCSSTITTLPAEASMLVSRSCGSSSATTEATGNSAVRLVADLQAASRSNC